MTRLGIEVIGLALIFWLESIFPLFKGRQNRLRHDARNASAGLLNALIIAFLFSALTLKTLGLAEAHSFGIIHVLPWHPWPEGLIAFVLFDLWMYAWHRANHQIPFLWRFHRMHHSDPEMNSTTALRFHPGEIVISSFLRLIVISVIGMDFTHLLIYESIFHPVIFFHHSNIALPEKIDRLFRTVIVTPNMHRVHHSQLPGETNSNYSSVFSFWDRLIRSFRKRAETQTLVFGLAEFQDQDRQTFAGMLKTPFINR